MLSLPRKNVNIMRVIRIVLLWPAHCEPGISDLEVRWISDPSKPMHFSAAGDTSFTFMPYWMIEGQVFPRFPACKKINDHSGKSSVIFRNNRDINNCIT